MLSVLVYGRNDSHGYNLHKRAVLSLNCMAEVLDDRHDEILFVDYNTPDDYPTFIEAVADTLTDRARRLLRVLRVRPSGHERFRDRTHLMVLEPIARNVGLRRSNPANRWILASNTDMIFVPRNRHWSLSRIAASLPDGHYHTPRYELPEMLWESFDRTRPRDAIRHVARLAPALHLNEIIDVGPPVVFDAPGDFQLILRRDLFAINGFDESMLLGWHIDSNIARRLTLLRGAVGSLACEVAGYHCDHTRQSSATHGRDRIENDLERYIDHVTRPELPEQGDDWGLPDGAVEEISVRNDTLQVYVRKLEALLPPPTANDAAIPAPYYYRKTRDDYNDLRYPAARMIVYLCDLLSSLPRSWRVGYFGCRADSFALFRQAWRSLGFMGAILIPDNGPLCHHAAGDAGAAIAVCPPMEAIAGADLLIFEFGLSSEGSGQPAAPDASRLDAPHISWSDTDIESLSLVRQGFMALVAAERQRLAGGRRGRRAVVINAVNNSFETLLETYMSFVYAPFGTRIRQGHILADTTQAGTLAPKIADRAALGRWLQTRLQQALPPPQAEITALENWARTLLTAPQLPSVSPAMAATALPLLAFLDFPQLSSLIADVPAERLAAARAAVDAARPSRALVPRLRLPVIEHAGAGQAEAGSAGLSRVARLVDWENPAWRAWAERAFGGRHIYSHLRRGRWIWERTQFLYGLAQLGLLRSDARAVLLACNPEPLAGLLSEQIGAVDVIDIRHPARAELPAAWFRPTEVLTPSRLRVHPLDNGVMPAIDGLADMVLLPQNSGFRDGLFGLPAMLEQAERYLRPGGVLVFTAELSLDDGLHDGLLPVICVERDYLAASIAQHTGLALLHPFIGSIDTPTLDRFSGEPTDGAVEAMVACDGGALHTTSLWFLGKRGETPAGGWPRVRAALVQQRLPDNLLAQLSLTDIARREDDGAVTVAADAPARHALFGPYLRLPSGQYRLEATVRVQQTEPVATQSAPPSPVLAIDVVIGDAVLAFQPYDADSLAGGKLSLPFTVPPDRGIGGRHEDGMEIRFAHQGNADLRIESVQLLPGDGA